MRMLFRSPPACFSMALSWRSLFFALVICITIEAPFHKTLVEAELKAPGAGSGSHGSALNCTSLCAVRCSAHSRPNLCARACGTCCFRCKCVPPGTSGNREMCGTCYANMTTHGNRMKCP